MQGLITVESIMDGYRFVNRIPGYHYYDTPEDEDCLKKVVFMNKLGLYIGFAAGSIDVLALSKPVGIANIAGRYGVITLPLLATGSAFAAATCLTANYRGKLDYKNAMVGGFVAGCTLGGVLRNGRLGTFTSLFFAAAAYAIGTAKEMGVTPWITPDQKVPLEFGGIWSIKYDWSLIEERPKGWKRADEV